MGFELIDRNSWITADGRSVVSDEDELDAEQQGTSDASSTEGIFSSNPIYTVQGGGNGGDGQSANDDNDDERGDTSQNGHETMPYYFDGTNGSGEVRNVNYFEAGADGNGADGETEYDVELGFVGNSANVTAGSILTVDTVPKDDSWRDTVTANAPGNQDLQQSSGTQQTSEQSQESVSDWQPNSGRQSTTSADGQQTLDTSTDAQTTDTDTTPIDGESPEENAPTGPRNLAPGQFPPAEPDPALIEKGRVHVEALRSTGAITDGAGAADEGRAAAILADDALLQQIGTLLGDGGSESMRAVEVLITDTGGSSGSADRYLSNLARTGAISLDEFQTLANDIAFLEQLVPLLEGADAASPTSPGADEQTLLALGGAELGNGNIGTVDENGLVIQEGEQAEDTVESSISVDGSTEVDQPEPLDENAITTPHNVTADLTPFPPELQTRLDEAEAAGGADPHLLRAAQVLTGTVGASPVEQFLAQSYMGGSIDLDTYIGNVNSPEFLAKRENEVAAEVLLGTAQDHSASDDFMNKIYGDGHITLEQYVADVNNPEKMTALDQSVAQGKVVYESEGFGGADAVLVSRSDEEIQALLHPGVNLNEGPPSVEQIAALHQLSGGRDQRFVELTAQWVLHHNPGYALQFGHPTQEAKDAGEPRSFFWTNNGQKVDDPFLNSLTGQMSSPDNRLHFDKGTTERHMYGEGELFESSLMIEVRIKYEGVTDDPDDELTDHSRHLENLIYPGVGGDADDQGHTLKERLKNADGIPIGLDDHYDGDYPGGAIGNNARLALETIDPTLTDGVQIHWIKGKDGVQIANQSQFEKTVVYVENSKNVHFTGNNGPLEFLGYGNEESITAETGSGEAPIEIVDEPIVQDSAAPGLPRIDPEDADLLDGIVHGALRDPEDLQTVQDIMNSPDPLVAAQQSERPPFVDLSPEQRIYVYIAVSEQIEASLAEQAGTDAPPDAEGTGEGVTEESPTGETGTDGTGTGEVISDDAGGSAGYRQWVDSYAVELLGSSTGTTGEAVMAEVATALRSDATIDDADRDAIYASAEAMVYQGTDGGTDAAAETSAEGTDIPAERLGYVESYVDYLVAETSGYPPEEAIAFIDGVLAGDPELTPAEIAYAGDHARRQLGLDASPDGQTGSQTGGQTDGTGDTPDDDAAVTSDDPIDVDGQLTGDGSISADRAVALDAVAASLYEHFGSVEDVAQTIMSDPAMQAYPPEEQNYILAKVDMLDRQEDTERTDAQEDWEQHKAERDDDSTVEWDEIAIAAKRDYTVNGDEFDTDAFIADVEAEDDLLPTREAKDYVIEATLRFAENGGLTIL